MVEKTEEKSLTRKEQGEETRRILVDVGARLFGTHGFHGVSMRQLVNEAGVNLSTVNYHFGSKAGLYEAIIQKMIDARNLIFPDQQEIEDRLQAAGVDRKAQAECVAWYIRQVVTRMIGDETHIWPAFIISRELAQPTSSYPELEEKFFDPSYESLFLLVSTVMPADADKEDLVISSQAIIGMIAKFLEGSRLISKRLGWGKYDAQGVDKLAAVLGKRVCGFLGLPMEMQ